MTVAPRHSFADEVRPVGDLTELVSASVTDDREENAELGFSGRTQGSAPARTGPSREVIWPVWHENTVGNFARTCPI